MDWSGYDRIGKLGLQFANLASGSTVSYEISDIYFTTDTSGNSGSGGKQDDPTTDINTDIEYNFAKLLQESLYLYDANMCGTDVTEKTGLSWRQNCHTEDQYASYNGQTVDVSGGYHDAGDHAKFALPQAYTASVLGMSYYQFKDAFTELGQTEHIQRILDHFAEYLEKCAVLDANGNVIAYCYQVGNGNTDHDYWVRFNCPEFTTLCPITGQPDYGTIYISYMPAERMVESKSLKLYLVSFRNHGDFHEDVVNVIMRDLIAIMAPKYIEVQGKFLPRGGISIDPYANYGIPGTKYEALAWERLSQHDRVPERVDNR
ncbi:preQ(1) synthase [uncultured Selenomonas sp.]|uniref:preQ(1) synthase n=2 Tax=uncultured Selenomonas sp. TaxID=159275 RepID=UPI002589A6A3|nr:preQ(1) synthase [uncultured Selenomonas sp.]